MKITFGAAYFYVGLTNKLLHVEFTSYAADNNGWDCEIAILFVCINFGWDC